MNSQLGQGLIIAALFFAASGSVLGFWAGARHHMRAWTWARRAAYGFSGSMIAANLLMGAAVLWLAGDLAGWLAAGEWARGGRMLLLVGAAMAVYFAVLAASGLRVRHFRAVRR